MMHFDPEELRGCALELTPYWPSAIDPLHPGWSALRPDWTGFAVRGLVMACMYELSESPEDGGPIATDPAHRDARWSLSLALGKRSDDQPSGDKAHRGAAIQAACLLLSNAGGEGQRPAFAPLLSALLAIGAQDGPELARMVVKTVGEIQNETNEAPDTIAHLLLAPVRDRLELAAAMADAAGEVAP